MKQHVICKRIADEAVAALIEEVQLTPKPGLVDTENNGAHHDLSLTKMQNSAHSLHNTFYQMAMLSFNRPPTVEIREQFGAIGRNGDKEMFAVTENSNTSLVKNNINTFKGICGFLNEYIKTINVVIQSTPVMKFPRTRVMQVLNAIKGVMNIMTVFIESISDKQFDALDNILFKLF